MEKMKKHGRCNVCGKKAQKGGDCYYCPACGWSQLDNKEKKERREKRDEKRTEWLSKHGNKRMSDG